MAATAISCRQADFVYDRDRNEYRCPAGQALIWRFTSVEKGMTLNRYWSSNCKGCPLKDKCTPRQTRRVTHWEHQHVLDDMQVHFEQSADAMRIGVAPSSIHSGPSSRGWGRRTS